ncbi:hypothetical protein LXL04_009334 [Taraxacum kok-saghyz]
MHHKFIKKIFIGEIWNDCLCLDKDSCHDCWYDLAGHIRKKDSISVEISLFEFETCNSIFNLQGTVIIICFGDFEIVLQVGYTAPTQAARSIDLNLSVAECIVQCALFGSTVTISAMIELSQAVELLTHMAMALSSVFCIAGWLAIYLAMGAVSLDLGRFFTGFGIGIFSYVVPIYVADISPKELRGGLTKSIFTQCSCVFFNGINGTKLEGCLASLFLLICYKDDDRDDDEEECTLRHYNRFQQAPEHLELMEAYLSPDSRNNAHLL